MNLSKRLWPIFNWILSLLRPIKPLNITKLTLVANGSIITVLVVQKDPAQRAILGETIQMVSDMKVVTAATQSEAFALIGEADVLLTDWEMNGEKDTNLLLEEWMRQDKGPICVLSLSPDAGLREDLYLQGVSNVLRKGVSIDVVIAVLRLYGKEAALRRLLNMSMQREYYLAQYIEMITEEVTRLKLYVPLSFIVILVLVILAVSDHPIPWDLLISLVTR